MKEWIRSVGSHPASRPVVGVISSLMLAHVLVSVNDAYDRASSMVDQAYPDLTEDKVRSAHIVVGELAKDYQAIFTSTGYGFTRKGGSIEELRRRISSEEFESAYETLQEDWRKKEDLSSLAARLRPDWLLIPEAIGVVAGLLVITQPLWRHSRRIVHADAKD